MVDRGAGSVEWMWIMRVSCWFGGRGFMGCVWVLATQRHGVFQNLPTSIRHTIRHMDTRPHSHIPATSRRRAGGEARMPKNELFNFSKSFHTPEFGTIKLQLPLRRTPAVLAAL